MACLCTVVPGDYTFCPLPRYALSLPTMPETEPAYQVVLNTCPDIETARILADKIIDAGYAACVNIVPGIESVYRWQDEVVHDEELLLVIKTHRDRYAQLEELILQHHPYELPEIIAVSIEAGLGDYLAWIGQSVGNHNV